MYTGSINVHPLLMEGIQLAVGPQPLRLRNHNSGLAHRIMVKRLATSAHDPLGITDSSCKNQLVVVSVQSGPFNPYIPIRSTTIGKSRVAKDPIVMHTSWRSNSDIASVTSIGYPRMSASDESSTTMHRLLHASGSHPIPTAYDPNARAKRCRINLCKRYRFAIAISKYHLLVNSSLRLDFLLYDVASFLRLDVQATCWYLATAGLKPSADYDDVTDDVINAKPSADYLARRRFISFTSLLIC
ncbi:dentin sialophosphoprotein-like [Dorcoceras hygrometricum]|uniref:Dentin sialophosphoprotein-like n=1 Tax=Dorcoceras hygrometricum TaxID=472368 RepID=A0A2Z7C1N9_9LAMI|nr:dentin sialophosphoprotein-like [Dorcoceras hygrometricum]